MSNIYIGRDNNGQQCVIIDDFNYSVKVQIVNCKADINDAVFSGYTSIRPIGDGHIAITADMNRADILSFLQQLFN